MPYILVSCSIFNKQTTRFSGPPIFEAPTFIDYHADYSELCENTEFNILENAMSDLSASRLGKGLYDSKSPFCSYSINRPPYLVLNVLEKHGYKVAAANSVTNSSVENSVQPVWQVWTLHKQT